MLHATATKLRGRTRALCRLGIALLLFFLIAEPQQAAQLVTNILNSLRTAAEALITFVRQLF